MTNKSLNSRDGRKCKIKVILDPEAGICNGVRRAIEFAERELQNKENRHVFVLGDIIHNEPEVERLSNAGLNTIYNPDLDNLHQSKDDDISDDAVLIRAHGEPPDTFEKLDNLGVKVINGTCTVVTRSQKLARKYHLKGYQVAIVGKHNHPEIVGIIGHTDGEGVIIQYDEDLKKLDPDRPTLVMAQTTIDPKWFGSMVEKILNLVKKVEVSETICRFVIRRHLHLPKFATASDVILVVGGQKSSNTKMLAATCASYNPRSYHIVSVEELKREWFKDAKTIGVTGSASTPSWLLHEFVETLNQWIERGWPCEEISGHEQVK